MIGKVVEKFADAVAEKAKIGAPKESFESPTGYETSPARGLFVSLITVTVLLGLILLAGKYLWNTVLVALIPAVKPAKSVWQILGLAILISLMYPGYCC
jgi:hypothetical protein